MTDADRYRKRIIDTEEPEPVPLEIALEHVEFIILKARAAEAQVAPIEPEPEPEAEPGAGPDEDEEAGVIGEHPDEEVTDELRDAITRLSSEAAIDLLALFWVGHGDFTRAEWNDARAQAMEQINGDLADYLMGEPGLGDMLEEGLNALGYLPEALEPDA